MSKHTYLTCTDIYQVDNNMLHDQNLNELLKMKRMMMCECIYRDAFDFQIKF